MTVLRLYAIFIWSTSLVGIYFFTKGFFLVRRQLPNKADRYLSETGSSHQVILILVDALRFDFIPRHPLAPNTSEHKLRVIKEILERDPSNSILLRTYSDPPTVTLARLKSITTGNLPSFIDLKDNFNSEEV
jgi:phosphatidylinositol glycan class O